jgi:tRNA A37 threonylcarbamoyladenosine biosynthesis protein TsaE
VVEWGRDFLDDVAANWLQIEIDRSRADEVRELTISSHGERWEGIDVTGD